MHLASTKDGRDAPLSKLVNQPRELLALPRHIPGVAHADPDELGTDLLGRIEECCGRSVCTQVDRIDTL